MSGVYIVNKDGTKEGRSNMRPMAMDVRKQMINDVGSTPLIVYEYYRQALRYEDYVITDEKVANALGIAQITVKRARLKLQKFNYFFEVSSKTKVMETYLYALGKVEVSKARYFNSLFGAQNLYEVRKKFSRLDVSKVLDGSTLSSQEKNDIMGALVPVTTDEKRYAPDGWYLTRHEYEELRGQYPYFM